MRDCGKPILYVVHQTAAPGEWAPGFLVLKCFPWWEGHQVKEMKQRGSMGLHRIRLQHHRSFQHAGEFGTISCVDSSVRFPCAVFCLLSNPVPNSSSDCPPMCWATRNSHLLILHLLYFIKLLLVRGAAGPHCISITSHQAWQELGQNSPCPAPHSQQTLPQLAELQP